MQLKDRGIFDTFVPAAFSLLPSVKKDKLRSKKRSFDADFPHAFPFFLKQFYCIYFCNNKMEKEQYAEKEWFIRTLKKTTHKLTYPQEGKDENQKFQADGYLVGKFYDQSYIFYNERIVFTGDFVGFFQDGNKYFSEEDKKKVPKSQDEGQEYFVYFEGRIENFKLVRLPDEPLLPKYMVKAVKQLQIVRQILAPKQERSNANQLKESQQDIAASDKNEDIVKREKERKKQKYILRKQRERQKRHKVDSGEFVGYFYGRINPLKRFVVKRSELKFEEIIHKSVILPVFTSFVLKKISKINLDNASAEVYGTMKINVLMNDWLIGLLQKQENQDLCIRIRLQRECSIELPFNKKNLSKASSVNKDFNKGLFDIVSSFNEKSKIMSFTVRKMFHAKLDGSYRQFFAPLNLVNVHLSLKFKDIAFPNPEGKDYQEITRIKFLCHDFYDYKEAQNPYCCFNDFHQLPEQQRDQKIKERATKVTLDCKESPGQYLIASASFTYFPYYCQNFANSNNQGSDLEWNLGLKKYNEYIKYPEPKSIRQSMNSYKIQKHPETFDRHPKVFKYREWNRIHIRIPIYKSWILIVIQIFFPMILLSALSLYVFSQENGLKEDGFSTINSRIANIASIMIAFVALIPVIKLSGPRAVNISFVYLAIILLAVPNFLALISTFVNRNITNEVWKSSYRTFKDTWFLISFVISATLLILVVILLIHFIIKTKLRYQAIYPTPKENKQPEEQKEQRIPLKSQELKQKGQNQNSKSQQMLQSKNELAQEASQKEQKLFGVNQKDGGVNSKKFKQALRGKRQVKKEIYPVEQSKAPQKFKKYMEQIEKNRREQYQIQLLKVGQKPFEKKLNTESEKQ